MNKSEIVLYDIDSLRRTIPKTRIRLKKSYDLAFTALT